MTASPPRERRTGGLPLPLKLLFYAGLPLLFLAMLAAAAVAAAPLLAGRGVDVDYRAPAGSSLRVTVPNARLDFVPADGDDVTVRLTGTYTGTEPALRVETVGEQTRVSGGCARQWLAICSIRVEVALPPDVDLSATGTNGEITAKGLDGSVEVGTTNGRIGLADLSGTVTATTTNGGIALTGATAEQVTARTTNGGVELDFAGAPTVVEARSTNGGIGIRLPDDGTSYFIDAETTNGNIGGSVDSDRTADRTITARTTNGGITVDWAR